MQKKSIISVALGILILLTGCNKGMNKSVVKSNNDDSLQLETAHFRFHSKEEDKKCLDDLSKTLEDNYIRVTSDLHTTLDKNIDIYIYSDLNTYHQAINQPNAPAWVIGNAVPGSNTIMMVNPLNVDGNSDFNKIIVHEFTHVVVSNINADANSIPIWLNDGTAAYEAQQTDGTNDTDIAMFKDKLETGPLSYLESDAASFGNSGGYQISYCVVEYIVKNYGYDKLKALIKSQSNFEEILGISKDDFQNNLVSYFNNM